MKKNIIVITLIFAAVLLASCKSRQFGTQGYGSATAQAIWPGGTGQARQSSGIYRTAPSGVVTVRFIVTAADITTAIQKDFAVSLGQGTISGIPEGAHRTLTLQGLDAGNTAIYEGSVPDVGIASGQTTDCGVIAMNQVVGDSVTLTESANQVRSVHSAVLLQDGKVLVSGGAHDLQPDGTGDYLDSAELYDPADRTFTFTGSMGYQRGWHFGSSPGVVLLNNGNVLVTGGYGDTNGSMQSGGLIAYSSAELYDPVTGTFSPTGSMTGEDGHHTATLLQNGTVLIAGNIANLYDPSTGIFSATGSMVNQRSFHAATLLPSGKVLFTGGFASAGTGILNSAELYDPATGTFSATGSMRYPRGWHQATLLPDGRVLITGGSSTSVWNGSAAVAIGYTEIYDPSTGVFSSATNMHYPRYEHTATLLLNGKVLIAGGNSGTDYTINQCEIYDPAGDLFAFGALIGANSHLATLLADGKVLITGSQLSFSQLYVPTSPSDNRSPVNPSLSINNGALSTSTPSVTLTLSASDDTGVVGYYASESINTPLAVPSTWMPVVSSITYSGSVPFTLSSGSGVKTVYVWFKDVAGNVSASASQSITVL